MRYLFTLLAISCAIACSSGGDSKTMEQQKVMEKINEINESTDQIEVEMDEIDREVENINNELDAILSDI